MVAEAKPDRNVVAAYLDEVEGELDAVKRLLVPPPSRYAAYHLEQAGEKLIKAVRLSRGLPATIEHNFVILINGLAEGDPWQTRLMTLEWLSAFATSYRYPTATSGFRKPGPAVDKIQECVKVIEAMLADARKDLLKV